MKAERYNERMRTRSLAAEARRRKAAERRDDYLLHRMAPRLERKSRLDGLRVELTAGRPPKREALGVLAALLSFGRASRRTGRRSGIAWRRGDRSGGGEW